MTPKMIFCAVVFCFSMVSYFVGAYKGYYVGYIEAVKHTSVRNCDGSFSYSSFKYDETVDSILRLKLCK